VEVVMIHFCFGADFLVVVAYIDQISIFFYNCTIWSFEH